MKNFFKNQFSIFCLSLVLAFILWLTVSGQDMSVHDLSANLELTGLPDNLALEEGIPDTVNLRIEANTAQFRFLEGRKYYFRYDLSDVEPGPNLLQIDWTAIIPSLPRGIRVARVIPEEISFQVYPYITKELPVTANVTGELPSYLEMTGRVIIDPPTAQVTGPAHRLGELTGVPTTTVRLNDIRNQDTTLVLTPQLTGLNTWLTVEPRSFQAHAQVRLKADETSFKIPVTVAPQSWTGQPLPLELRPAEAAVQVSWTLDHATPQPDDIKLTVTLTPQDLEKPGNIRLTVNAQAPNWIKILKIEPASVMVTKLKVPEPEPPEEAAGE
ncbi:MAG: hypothetical protein LBP22_06155 [Deltaproteobacteria bacterium]|jgi:YbbR domain-containing protein|nr:hypothetical protein [Deltaproteobacteria bacterium]